MNVLFLAHRVPYPPNKGEKIRAYRELVALAADHAVSLAAYTLDDAEESAAREGLGEICRRIHLVRRRRFPALSLLRCFLRSRPLTFAFFAGDRRLEAGVDALAREEPPDLVWVYSSAVAPYAARFPGACRIADLVDIDSEKWREYAKRSAFPRRLVYTREARTLRAVEESVVSEFDASLVVSRAEAALLGEELGGRIRAVSNGVDTEFFRPAGTPPTGAPGIVFTGTMDYLPNVDSVTYFAEEVFPLVRREEPQATFTIVGAQPTARVLQLARRPGISVTGTVPDVRPYLNGAAVAVAPLRIARGVQNKVLEAMAAGLPVVMTPQAAEGLELGPSEGFVAEATGDLASAVVRLLRDPVLRAATGARARDAVLGRYSWSRFEDEIRAVVREAPRGGLAARR